MVEVPENLVYTKDHEWAKKENGRVKVGITDYAQDKLGDIVYVELPEVGKELNAGDVLGVVESVKSASDVYSPVSGKVVEVNSELEDSPSLVNEEPYGNGWIAVVEMSKPEELEDLLAPEDYRKLIGE